LSCYFTQGKFTSPRRKPHDCQNATLTNKIHFLHTPERYARAPSCAIPGNASFHASARREEDAAPAAAVPAPKGGIMGTGVS